MTSAVIFPAAGFVKVRLAEAWLYVVLTIDFHSKHTAASCDTPICLDEAQKPKIWFLVSKSANLVPDVMSILNTLR